MSRIYQRKPGGVYWIDYSVNGERKRESTGSSNKKLAEQILHRRLGDVVKGKFDVVNLKKAPTLNEFSENFLQWSKSNKRSWTRDQTSLNNLLPFFGKTRLNAITPYLVEQYRIERKKLVKEATINREVALLKNMLNRAVEWQFIGKNPIEDFKLYKESTGITNFLSREECERLIDASSDTFQWIVITAIHTGMRKMEILNLKWSQVNLESGMIMLHETKNGKPRYIPLDRTMIDLLNSIPHRSDYVFAQKNGEPYSWIGRAWKNATAKADVNLRFHDLRHTFASHLVMAGVDLPTVKELLGHSSISMVMRYAHLSPEHKQKAVRALDRVFESNIGTNVAHGTNIHDIKEAVNY